MKDSISVIIPAYNEENSILDAINVVKKIISMYIDDYEIIVVDDGSTDSTGSIIDTISKKNKKISVIHHKKNVGFGQTFNDGLKQVKKSFFVGFPADNDLSEKAFSDIVKNRNPNNIVSSYMISMKEREFSRKCISISFIKLMNFVFSLNLRYYNGYFICPSRYLSNLQLKSKGFTIFAEIKIRLWKKGIKITEIPFIYKARPYGSSKALAFKNICQILIFLPTLVKDIYLSRI